MLSLYVYFEVVHDGTGINALVMAGGFALSGFAESLPAERRRLAAGLRVTAILLLLCLLGLLAVAPEVVLGPR